MANDEYGDSVWEPQLPEVWDGIHGRRLIREEGRPLSGAVWELPPGSDGVDYHFHHGTEEFLVVLRGTATLRTPAGERDLAEGSVAHFSPGPEGGAHRHEPEWRVDALSDDRRARLAGHHRVPG
jgi:quercetin dioxygenase-like cupin family protein